MSEIIIAIAIACQANSPNARFVHSPHKLRKEQLDCLKNELKKDEWQKIVKKIKGSDS